MAARRDHSEAPGDSGKAPLRERKFLAVIREARLVDRILSEARETRASSLHRRALEGKAAPAAVLAVAIERPTAPSRSRTTKGEI
jgi:hypothetical protein